MRVSSLLALLARSAGCNLWNIFEAGWPEHCCTALQVGPPALAVSGFARLLHARWATRLQQLEWHAYAVGVIACYFV